MSHKIVECTENSMHSVSCPIPAILLYVTKYILRGSKQKENNTYVSEKQERKKKSKSFEHPRHEPL
jgi:hypothetical protein